MGLAAYELLQGQATTGERGRGWMAHIEGATPYLNMYPDLNVYEFSHEACFHFLETICIFDALGARRPSCFSSSKWWRYSVDRLGDQGYEALLRMITTLPAVLEKADAAISLPPTAQAATTWTELLALCERLEDAFLDWFERNLGGNETCQAQPVLKFQRVCSKVASLKTQRPTSTSRACTSHASTSFTGPAPSCSTNQ